MRIKHITMNPTTSLVVLGFALVLPALCGSRARAQVVEEVLHHIPAAGTREETTIVRDARTGVPTVRRERVALAAPDGGASGEETSPLANADFSAGLDGWDASESGGGAAPGGVSSAAGGALLVEGDSFLVTLEQTFVLPAGASVLSFTLVLEPGFDQSATFIPDAFEVSLLDATNAPVTSTWDPLAASFFNLGEDATAHAAPGVTWDGATVRIALDAASPATPVTLYFDLIGADEDTTGGVRIDDVSVETGPPQGDFIRGDANTDFTIDISDSIFALTYLFIGGATPRCVDAADTDDDGQVNITDSIYALNYLFLGGPAIRPPYPGCGTDPVADTLSCAENVCPE